MIPRYFTHRYPATNQHSAVIMWRIDRKGNVTRALATLTGYMWAKYPWPASDFDLPEWTKRVIEIDEQTAMAMLKDWETTCNQLHES